DEQVAAGLDSMASLYTGLTAFRPFPYRPARLFYGDDSQPWLTPQELADYLESLNARYVLDTPMPGFAEYGPFRETLEQLVAARPGWLTPVYVGDDDRFVIYKIDTTGEPGERLARQR
ncbi:MAG: hypothetical protein AAF961_08965, partial [Planctomycetota bacterium]